MNEYVLSEIDNHINTVTNSRGLIARFIEQIHPIIVKAVRDRHTIFFCGNGGSAADSQHLAAELVGRFKYERGPLPALALSTDTSVLTCLANDYSYEEIFCRQIGAHGKSGDVLITLSTSGMSSNIIKAIMHANELGLTTIGLFGKDGGEAKNHTMYQLIIDSNNTARIQESHIMVGHILCGIIDEFLISK